VVIERQGCNSFYCICGHHFDYARAPHVFGNSDINYGRVISTAMDLGLSVKDAEKYGADKRASKPWSRERALATHRTVKKIATEARLPLEEALKLHQQAKSGDKVAQSKIRAARGRVDVSSQAEVEADEDEVSCVLFGVEACRPHGSYPSAEEDAGKETDDLVAAQADQVAKDAEGNAHEDKAIVMKIASGKKKDNAHVSPTSHGSVSQAVSDAIGIRIHSSPLRSAVQLELTIDIQPERNATR